MCVRLCKFQVQVGLFNAFRQTLMSPRCGDCFSERAACLLCAPLALRGRRREKSAAPIANRAAAPTPTPAPAPAAACHRGAGGSASASRSSWRFEWSMRNWSHMGRSLGSGGTLKPLLGICGNCGSSGTAPGRERRPWHPSAAAREDWRGGLPSAASSLLAKWRPRAAAHPSSCP